MIGGSFDFACGIGGTNNNHKNVSTTPVLVFVDKIFSALRRAKWVRRQLTEGKLVIQDRTLHSPEYC